MGWPGAAAVLLVTVCHPGTGVMIWVRVPISARTAPAVVEIAVAVNSPVGGMTRVPSPGVPDRRHWVERLRLSWTTPPEISVPACPTAVSATELFEATRRLMPLILTTLERPA